jgi:hypothetical protein
VILSSDLPDLAATWLVNGLDTPALRELAGHSRGDAWGIDALWAEARDQLGIVVSPSLEDQTAIVARYELAAWRVGRRDLLAIVNRLVRLWVAADYPDFSIECGQLSGLEDELQGGWGRDRRAITAEMETALTRMEAELGPRVE